MWQTAQWWLADSLRMTPRGFEPLLPPWKGGVLTAWPWSQKNSPSRTQPTTTQLTAARSNTGMNTHRKTRIQYNFKHSLLFSDEFNDTISQDIMQALFFFFISFSLEPHHSPDLNPIEQCWRIIRREVTHIKFPFFITFAAGHDEQMIRPA